MDKKICTKCGDPKDLLLFSKRTASADGKSPKCKECARGEGIKYREKNGEKIKATKKAYSEANPEKIKLRGRRYYIRNSESIKAYVKKHSADNPDVNKRAGRAYREKYPERDMARRLVSRAVKSGKLKRLPCQKCKTNESVEAHHWDYSKPLDVLWYCTKHHADISMLRF